MEAVYYAARANLQRKLSPTSELDTSPIGPGDRHVGKLGRHMEKTALEHSPRR